MQRNEPAIALRAWIVATRRGIHDYQRLIPIYRNRFRDGDRLAFRANAKRLGATTPARVAAYPYPPRPNLP